MPIERPHDDVFLTCIAAAMGLGDRIHSTGTSIVASEARAESNAAVVYSIAEHTVVWCDPALAAALAPLADPLRTRPLDEVSSMLTTQGWTHTDHGVMLLRSETPVVDDITGVTVRQMRHGDASDEELMATFVASLSAEDRNEADLDDGPLDDHVLLGVDDTGVAAFASERPFDFAPGFGDIAVATRPDRRGQGLGRLLVERLCREIVDLGMVPLYRHATANVGSARLSAALGFTQVLELGAYSPS